MANTKLKEFLDQHNVRYVSIEHSPAFTAPEVAASAHIAGRNFAKTVMVEISGRMAMAIVPADRKIVLSDLRDSLGEADVKLASEADFEGRFPDCEIGAMPPFGNLFGLPVYMTVSLAAEPEIAFNAGSHHEVIKMPFADYAELVKPIVLDFAMT